MNPHKTRVVRCRKDLNGAERYGFTCTCFPEGRAWYTVDECDAYAYAAAHEDNPMAYALHDADLIHDDEADIIPDETEPEEPAVEWAECTYDEFHAAIDDGAPRRSDWVPVNGRCKEATRYADAAWLAKHRKLAKPWEVLPDGLYVVDPLSGDAAPVRVADGHVSWSGGTTMFACDRDELAKFTWHRIDNEPAWTPEGGAR